MWVLFFRHTSTEVTVSAQQQHPSARAEPTRGQAAAGSHLGVIPKGWHRRAPGRSGVLELVLSLWAAPSSVPAKQQFPPQTPMAASTSPKERLHITLLLLPNKAFSPELWKTNSSQSETSHWTTFAKQCTTGMESCSKHKIWQWRFFLAIHKPVCRLWKIISLSQVERK